MIAASKLKRAQDAALSSRPYVKRLSDLVQDISQKVEDKTIHPYIHQETDSKKTLIVALSPDKGLCGSLITNLIREFLSFTKENPSATYIVCGKKLEAQVAKLPNEVLASFVFGTTLPKFEAVFPIIQLINDLYINKKISSVKVLYTDFSSIFSQVPKVATLLPITLSQPEVTEKSQKKSQLYEPGVNEILPSMLKHYIEMALYQFLLESYLSEQASRMIAMQNATNNAKDIIEALKLEYNKTRQSKITSELLDITGSRRAQQYGEQ